MRKFLTSPARLWISILTILVMAGIGAGGLFAKGYWDWDKKQIWELRAHKLRPPTTPGNNYTLDIGLASRTARVYGDMDIMSATDLDVKSGGEIEIESGGLADVLSGGELDINAGATLDVNGNMDLTGSTITATGLITATHIADWTGEWTSLDLGAAYVDGSGPITTATAPGIGASAIDNIAAIVWDGSDETTGVQWTVRVPDHIVTTNPIILLRCLVSSDGTDYTKMQLTLRTWLNEPGSAFGTTSTYTTTATCDETALSTKNDVLTLYVHNTVLTTMAAGDWLTFEILNSSTSSTVTDNMELKGVNVMASFTR